jgi:TRAP-type C4-dicarboxylate transport system permease small subunit
MIQPKTISSGGTATKLDQLLNQLASTASALAAFSLVAMVVIQAWQVLARYGFNHSPGWTEPLTLFFLNATMSFAAAVGVHERAHFRFSLLLLRLPKPLQQAVTRMTATIIFLIGCLLACYGAQLGLDGIGIAMAGTALPQSAPFLPLCAGGCLIALFALPQLIRGPMEQP